MADTGMDVTRQRDRANDDFDQEELAPWIERLARVGYGAKGIVYLVIGTLSAQAALGPGGETAGTRGALQSIVTQPFGQVMLAVIAIALLGYVLWRFVQAIADPENRGSDWKGLAHRAGYLASGLAYSGIALTAAQLIIGSPRSGGGDTREDWTARVLALPFGTWLVGAVGVVIIGVALAQLYRAYKASFADRWNASELSETQQEWATRLGRLGLTARGVVYAIIGSFVIRAAMQYDPEEAGGLSQALSALDHQPYGTLVLGAVALGFIAYGVYSLLLARYRRIEPS